MDRANDVRKPRNSTADLLTWSETPPPAVNPNSGAAVAPGNENTSGARSHMPSDGISKIFSGDQITEEEAESFTRRKPCSGYKLKEITGNNIFAADDEDDAPDSSISDFNSHKRTSVRIVQQATNGISQISFSADENVSPKKPVTLPEVAKQRELSGTLECESDMKMKKHQSDAKCKELIGNDIFGPPPEAPPRSLAAARNLESRGYKDMEEPAPRSVHTSVRVSNPAGGQSSILLSEEHVTKTTKKIHNQKCAELSGNNIFRGDDGVGTAEKAVSEAKLREMTGSNIFADGKAASRDYRGGVRKPPGGESSIALL